MDFAEAARVVRPTVDDSQLDAYAAWDKKFGCLPPPSISR
ncbi:Spastin/Vps4 C-terminal domain-containing protein [Caenorhabditis elegans]|nr:Spastin/Vps4 C-terminal domain-containing protein [Caenorhabditis elegans]SAP35566.1 Spastin/Vps4 C-terminal domain-containing protein [Caenorhabditis elegans]|eukprot:NP_001317806.1 Fidgetin-like protein 1 [Caenorhabditis elegans]